MGMFGISLANFGYTVIHRFDILEGVLGILANFFGYTGIPQPLPPFPLADPVL